MSRWLPWLSLLGAFLMMAALPARAQLPAATYFGGASLGNPSGFTFGAGMLVGINHDLLFEPTAALGRFGHVGNFTLDGSLLYQLHPDDEAFIPYLLAGVGLAQYSSATHGSPLVGVGARIPIGHNTWLQPEVRAGTGHMSRLTIGFTRSF